MTPHWILVDGYSVIHAWPDLAEQARQHLGAPPARHLAGQRDALVGLLQRYADHRDVRVTVVFDGYAAKHRPDVAQAPGHLEVAFSGAGKTADDLIERQVAQARDRAGILVVTADNLERHTVEGLGAHSRSVELFAVELTAALADLGHAVQRHSPRSASRRKGVDTG